MRKLLLLAITFMLFSCEKNIRYVEVNRDFEQNRWPATDIKKFEFNLDNDIESGDIKLVFSHIHEPQYNEVPVLVTIQYPDGKKENIAVNLLLKDASGKDMSDCAGDVCDLSTSIKEKIKLVKGSYMITVQNKFSNAYLINVLGLGINVVSDTEEKQ